MLVEAQGRKLRDVLVWPLSLDKRAYFGISTWKQMLVEARKKISGFKMAAPCGGMLDNFCEAAIDFGWVCVG